MNQSKLPFMFEIRQKICPRNEVKSESLIKKVIDLNQEVASSRQLMRDFSKPECGDFIQLSNGKTHRIGKIENNEITVCNSGDYFLFKDGSCQSSGWNDFTFIYNSIVRTNHFQSGKVWMFDRDEIVPNNRVNLNLDFIVWKISSNDL